MSGANTREDILDAAERIFGESGYEGASVRAITDEAGANVAAINYHFGGKRELLRGVTDRIVGPLNDRRFDLLDAVLRQSNPASVESVVDAFIRPDIETLQRLQSRGPNVAHFLGRIYSDQRSWIREMTYGQFIEAERRFFPVLGPMLEHISVEQLSWRMRRVAAMVVELFASWPEEGMTDEAAERTIRHLVSFIAAALRAPVPEVNVPEVNVPGG